MVMEASTSEEAADAIETAAGAAAALSPTGSAVDFSDTSVSASTWM
jgi:hypothetical protein